MSDNNIPYWIRVLNHFENRKYIQNGLTIPFLIGSRAIIEPGIQLFTVREFFEDFLKSECPISIMRCNNINEYIIATVDQISWSWMNNTPNPYREYNFIVTDNSFDKFIFEEIIDELCGIYNDKLKSFKYSKYEDVWNGFSEIEIERLLEILN